MLTAAVFAYLVGSIPVAVLVGRLRNVDPRLSGDHNAGWWNMRSLVGRRLGLVVLAGDVAKGCLAAFIGQSLTNSWWGAYVVVGAAMVGHSFPIFARLRGGKSILVFAGAMAVVAPGAVALALCAGALIGIIIKSFAVALRVAMALFPFAQALFHPLSHVAATGALMTFIGLRFASGHIRDRASSYWAEGGRRRDG